MVEELNSSSYASPVYEQILDTVKLRYRFMENEVLPAP